MPSFLNKVFGYRKHDDKEAARPTREPSDTTLLDGKYEAIPSFVSPTNSTFAEAQQSRDSDREVGFSLFRPKTRGVTQKHSQRRTEDVPHLTLQLPGPKETSDSRALGVVFEADPDAQIVLTDADIAAKRLNPLEALILVRACAQAITERGLETLGIMHPHWLSASPDVQRRLISLFIRSLTQSRITTLSPTPTSSTSAFENELHYTRSPHDVAAVLRWGLRHLSLENGNFGNESGWYNAFFDAERNESYPPKGFSELLLPHLPTPHAELLTATLSLISSLASHAEVNSISGSKLSKFLGLWLLVSSRAEQSDDWTRFYARWERTGRILEHLFLARLRDESVKQRLPTRLQELVKHYPYSKGFTSPEDDLLPRPRFSTRQYDALFVRVESLLTHSAQQPKPHPIQLLLDAFQLPFDNLSGDEFVSLWSTLKDAAFDSASSSNMGGPQFSRIFVDETIHLLSLIPADNSVPTSPTLLTTPIAQVVSSEPSSSISQALERAFSAQTNGNNVSSPVSPTSPSSVVITDWAQFTLSGFGDTATAQPLSPPVSQDDDDIEVTQPKIVRKSSRHRAKSRTRRRRSEEHEPSEVPPQPESEPPVVETKLASVHVAQIDEAFVDFWSDAIVDPISANWPTFVLCGLKQVANVQQAGIRWLVIEQTYSRQEPQPFRVPTPDGRRGRSPRPSFKSDISGFRINSVFASARKRFSVFNKSATDLDVKKSGGKTSMAGELGEVLMEEPTSPPSPMQADARIDGKRAVKATVVSGAIADVADQLKADEVSTAPNAAVPTIKESGAIGMKALSVEPTPQPTGVHPDSGTSVLSHPPVKPLEEIALGPRTVDVNMSATPVTMSTPLAAAMSDSRATQASNPPSMDDTVPQDTQIKGRQGTPAKIEDLPVAQPANHDGHVAGEPSNAVQANPAEHDAKRVATSPPPEIITLVAAAPAVAAVTAAVTVMAPEPAVEEQHEVKQRQIACADPAAALSVESRDPGEIDDLFPVISPEVVATESGPQLESSLEPSVANEVKEATDVAEHAEIPSLAPEHVLVEDTPGQKVSVDGHVGAAQVTAAKPEDFDSAAPQLEVVDDAASQPVAAELQATLEAEAISITQPVQAPCIVAASSVYTSLQAVATESVPESAAEATLLQTRALPEVALDVSAGNVPVSTSHTVDVAPAEVVPQAAPESFFHEERIEGTEDTVTTTYIPVLEAVGPDPAAAADVHELVPPALDASPELKVESQTTVIGAVVEVIPLNEEAPHSFEMEPSARVHDIPAVEPFTPVSNQEFEATAAALAKEVGVAAVNVDTLSAPASIGDREALPSAPEDAPVEDAVVIVIGASEPATKAAVESVRVDDETAVDPTTEETPALVCDAALDASEAVAITPSIYIPASTTAPDGPTSSEPATQYVDEAAEASVATVDAVSVPEETVVDVVHPTAEEPLVAVALELVPVEIVVSAEEPEEPERPAAEPAAAAPDVPVPEEAEASAPPTDEVPALIVEVPEEAEVADEPPAAEPTTIVVITAEEPEALEVEPVVVETIAPEPVVDDAPVPVIIDDAAPEEAEASAVEVPTTADEPQATPQVEEAVIEVVMVVPVIDEDALPEAAEASAVEAPTTVDEPQVTPQVEETVVEVVTVAPVIDEDAVPEVEEASAIEVPTTVDEPQATPQVEEAVVEVVMVAPVVDEDVVPEAEETSAVEVPTTVDEPQATPQVEEAVVEVVTVAPVIDEDAVPEAAEASAVEVPTTVDEPQATPQVEEAVVEVVMLAPVIDEDAVPEAAETSAPADVEIAQPTTADEPQVEETVVVISVAVPAAEPALNTIDDAPAPVLEDQPTAVDAETFTQVAVEVHEPLAAGELQDPDPAPQVEEIVVVVASPAAAEALAAEPAVVEDIVFAPVVEDVDAPVLVDAEAPPSVVVVAAEPVVPSQPEAVKVEETTQIDERQVIGQL